jgi:phage terminase large subunit-like protein
VRPLFGWKRPDGRRRYRLFYIELPRGNGKSTLCAGLALYMLFCDGEGGAEVYSCALDREMAGLVYDPAKEMVRRCSMLLRRAKLMESAKRILVPSTASFYRPLPGNEAVGHGYNSHFFVYDELHLAKSRDLWDAMVTSLGKRANPLGGAITTAGSDRTTICWELHGLAEKVLENPELDPSFLPVIYAADEQDDWTDEKTWAKANPGFGISVQIDEIREACERAKQSPAFENTFRRLHLNQWTEQDVRVIPMDAWRACARPELKVESLAGRPCFGGLDLASSRDITAWVKVFELPKGELAWFARYWMPKDAGSDRTEQDRRQAMNFAERGLITLTEGTEVDYFRVVDEIGADCRRFGVLLLGTDPWNARMPLQAMVNAGFPEDRRLLLPQTFATYNEPFKLLLGRLSSRKFVHNGDPVLEWMASNVGAKTDPSGNIRPDKSKSGSKIDGICAGLMGTALWIQHKAEHATTSVYEKRGVRVLDGRGDEFSASAEPEFFEGENEWDPLERALTGERALSGQGQEPGASVAWQPFGSGSG